MLRSPSLHFRDRRGRPSLFRANTTPTLQGQFSPNGQGKQGGRNTPRQPARASRLFDSPSYAAVASGTAPEISAPQYVILHTNRILVDVVAAASAAAVVDLTRPRHGWAVLFFFFPLGFQKCGCH